MENKKQYLIEKTIKEIKQKEEEIKKSDEGLEILETELKVEKRFFEMEDINNEIKENIKYSVGALEDMIFMERSKNDELKKDLQISKMRKQIIDKFGEDEL